mgnify:FL=1
MGPEGINTNSKTIEKKDSGFLYLVSTPIGNLQDITYRAVHTLKSCDLVVAEDTRQSKKLLNHYEISTPCTSYHDHNKIKVTPGLVEQLKHGKSISLITDAGTPGISDPAFYLVRECLKQSICVQAIPGATALIPALVISGLPTDRFVFEGFLPPRKGRKKRIESLVDESRTIILYESPYRVMKTLLDLREILGNRRVVVARELTKKFETVVYGDLDQMLRVPDRLVLKGEFVIVLEGLTRERSDKSV